MIMIRAVFLLGCAVVCSCGGYSTVAEEFIDYETDTPELPGERVVAPYTGGNATVLEAQASMRTGFDLHRKVIQRSCSPLEGVCHNQKEYPDLRTTESFLATIGAPCNVVPKHWSTVFDRCERQGDIVRFADRELPPTEVGYIHMVRGDFVDYRDEEITPTADSPGLHFYLRDPVALDNGNNFYGTAELSRSFSQDGNVTELVFERFTTRFWVLDDGRHVLAEVPDYRRDAAEALLTIGIYQGDHNRNGIYGASVSNPVSLLNPGKALESYLVARLMGKMLTEPVPGTRMPLANLPPTVPEMLALACFIEALPQDGSPASLSWPIDYANCSFNVDPDVLALTGTGAPTWSASVWPLLQANCGGCHVSPAPSGGLDLVQEGAYTRILGLSSQQPSLRLIEPGDPDASYLWMKLTDADGISGSQMPFDPSTGPRPLTDEELSIINQWITAGALQD